MCLRLADDDGDATWCVFSDDDDLWHPDRVAAYDAAIAAAARDAEVLVSPVYGANRRLVASARRATRRPRQV